MTRLRTMTTVELLEEAKRLWRVRGPTTEQEWQELLVEAGRRDASRRASDA